MDLIKKTFRFCFSIYGFLVFLGLMFILLPLFAIAFLQNSIKCGNLIYKISRFWADAFFFMTGITHRNIYEEPHNINTEYIFVSNHISYLDIPMMMKVIRGQYIRILGKSEMTKIPIFGSIYKSAAVTVDRVSPEGRFKSVKSLIGFIQQKISVFICPEGTFNMTNQPLKNFYDGAFRIAIETQKPIRPILFLDTYDRLNYNSIFSLNPGKCRGVYLSETITEGLTPKDVPALKKKIFQQMEEALIRYKVSWIKENSL
ncbi:MAG: lysophospholipid acyltransferase family protein [Bacteroidota bacterium]|jgi:1-acyl-sn-glycerol-3-phosphate acyltransferase|nr:lysophospholipid acyltransferase family protein [Bacteroidota bacterium]